MLPVIAPEQSNRWISVAPLIFKVDSACSTSSIVAVQKTEMARYADFKNTNYNVSRGKTMRDHKLRNIFTQKEASLHFLQKM